MVRKFAAMLVLALVGLGLPAAAAGARSIPPPPPCSNGSVTITTSVRLTANYTCAKVDVLGSSTSVTTINLAGFALTGTITLDAGATKVINGTVAGSFTESPVVDRPSPCSRSESPVTSVERCGPVPSP